MTTPIFSYTPDELSAQMTTAVHDTLHYLRDRGMITDDDVEELTNILFVTAIPNKKGFGRRILERMFSSTSRDSNAWVFPIVELDLRYNNNPEPATPIKPKKPELTIV